MNGLAGILATTGTALVSGSTLALRADRKRRTVCAGFDPRNYRDLPADGEDDWPHAENTHTGWWQTITGTETGAWPHPAGSHTEAAPSSYSDGARLIRGTAAKDLPRFTPGTPAVPRAPKLTAGDLRRIRRRFRRDTRSPRHAQAVRIGKASLALAITLAAYKILVPALHMNW